MIRRQYKLADGDVIFASMRDIPLLDHSGIVIYQGGKPFIWHLRPGDNIIKESLIEFIKGREILMVRKTGRSSGEILSRIELLREKQYNLLNFNCLDFIKAVTG